MDQKTNSISRRQDKNSLYFNETLKMKKQCYIKIFNILIQKLFLEIKEDLTFLKGHYVPGKIDLKLSKSRRTMKKMLIINVNSQGLRQKTQVSYSGMKIYLALDLNIQIRETSAFSIK